MVATMDLAELPSPQSLTRSSALRPLSATEDRGFPRAVQAGEPIAAWSAASASRDRSLAPAVSGMEVFECVPSRDSDDEAKSVTWPSEGATGSGVTATRHQRLRYYAIDWFRWLSSDDDRCQEAHSTPGNFQWVSAGSEVRIITMGGGKTPQILPNPRIVENDIEVGVLAAELEHDICQLLSLPPECVKVVLEVLSDNVSIATAVYMSQSDETFHLGEVCFVCAQPCDADHTREGNCTRCHICDLCPQCNVIDKRGNPCCFVCLDRGDRDHVEANYQDKMFRIRLLGAQMLDE